MRLRATARRATWPRRRSGAGSSSTGSTSSSGTGGPRADGQQVARAGRRRLRFFARKPSYASSLAVRLDRLLQRHDDRRRPAMVLAFLAEAHAAVVGQRGAIRRRRRIRRPHAAPARPRRAPRSRCRRSATPCRRSRCSMTSWPRPSASKICAPQYEESVEMPIFDRILSSPFSAAVRKRRPCFRRRAARRLGRCLLGASRLLAEDRVDASASASHGWTASAP